MCSLRPPRGLFRRNPSQPACNLLVDFLARFAKLKTQFASDLDQRRDSLYGRRRDTEQAAGFAAYLDDGLADRELGQKFGDQAAFGFPEFTAQKRSVARASRKREKAGTIAKNRANFERTRSTREFRTPRGSDCHDPFRW
jgi:hypothetical protein